MKNQMFISSSVAYMNIEEISESMVRQDVSSSL